MFRQMRIFGSIFLIPLLLGCVSNEKFSTLEKEFAAYKAKNDANLKLTQNAVSFVYQKQTSFQEIYKNADYLVHLRSYYEYEESDDEGKIVKRKTEASLSGFIIEYEKKPYVLTACHINGSGLTIVKIEVEFKNQAGIQEVELIGCDSNIDVAVLAFKDKNFHYNGRFAVLGDNSTSQVCDPVISMGTPKGIYKWNGACGCISNLQVGSDFGHKQFKQKKLILHTALIAPGNSGGPLVNEKGEVVGMNVMVIGGRIQVSSGSLWNTDTVLFVANRIDDIKLVLPDLVKGKMS